LSVRGQPFNLQPWASFGWHANEAGPTFNPEKGDKVDKDKLSRLISIVLSAVLAVLATFGYHIVVVQPQLQAAAALAEQLCK